MRKNTETLVVTHLHALSNFAALGFHKNFDVEVNVLTIDCPCIVPERRLNGPIWEYCKKRESHALNKSNSSPITAVFHKISEVKMEVSVMKVWKLLILSWSTEKLSSACNPDPREANEYEPGIEVYKSMT